MFITKILTDIPLVIISAVFITSLVYTIKKYREISTVLKSLCQSLLNYNFNNLSYRFVEFKALMRSNYITRNSWNEFSGTLIFSDMTSKNGVSSDDAMSTSASEIKTTSKVEDYFNIETLAYNHYNKHVVSIIPTILTGFGPLFTFVIIGIAFGKLDFTSSQILMKTISEFVMTMQLAALCSVVAVASALIFMAVEKFMFSKLILPEVIKIQSQMVALFRPVLEEQFLIDLLVAVKNQNSNSAELLKNIPQGFSTSIKKDMTNMIIPYLDSIISGMNNVNNSIEKSLHSDDIEDIF